MYLTFVHADKAAQAQCPAEIIATPWGRLINIPLTFHDDFSVDAEILIPLRRFNRRSYHGLNFEEARPGQAFMYLKGDFDAMANELNVLGQSCIARASMLASLLGHQIRDDLNAAWRVWQHQIVGQLAHDWNLPSAQIDLAK